MLSSIARWSWFRKGVALVLLLGVGIVTYAMGVSWYRSQWVAAEVERLRSAGVPTGAEELNAWVVIRRGEVDATGAWRTPIDMIGNRVLGRKPLGFDVLEKSFQLLPAPGDDWPELDKAKQFVAKHQSLYDAIDVATATEGRCAFITDFRDGDIVLPHAQYGRQIVKLLKLRAYIAAHEGDRAAAAQDLIAMLKTMRILQHEPIGTSQICLRAYTEEVVPVVEQLLPDIAAEEEQLIEIQQLLEEIDTHQCVKLSAIGDRVMGMTAFADPSTSGAKHVPSPVYALWVGDSEYQLLMTLRNLDEAIGDAWPAPLSLVGRYEDIDWDSVHVKAPVGRSEWYAPTNFAKNLSNSVTRFAIAEARAKAGAIGIASVRFHTEHGRWPSSLDELVPQYMTRVPIDPFSGSGMLMKEGDGELVIYSVGANRQDDGGVEVIPMDDEGVPKFDGLPDVVFRVKLD